jgi:uncharacterized protein with FMN-binding domain
MKRAPLVITGTLMGLVGVFSFNSTPANLSLGSLSAAAPPRSSTTTTAPATTTTTTPATTTTTPPSGGGSTPPTTTTPPATTTTTVAPTTTTTGATTTRSATGTAVNYNFGILSVKVTASGSKITNVSIASIDDGGNPRSQFIDQQSIPQLEQQALSAQSAQIQGVSGASYTTAGFAQSLQSALSKLGLK